MTFNFSSEMSAVAQDSSPATGEANAASQLYEYLTEEDFEERDTFSDDSGEDDDDVASTVINSDVERDSGDEVEE